MFDEADRIASELVVLSGHVRSLASRVKLWEIRNGVQ